MIGRAIARAATAGVLLCCAWPAAAWETQKAQSDGQLVCVMFEQFPDGAMVSFVISKDAHDDGMFLLHAVDPDWPFKEHQDIGDVFLAPRGERMFDEPSFSIDHGFVQFLPASSLREFVMRASTDGFMIMRDQSPIGLYSGEGMMLAYSVLQECVRGQFGSRDAFAK